MGQSSMYNYAAFLIKILVAIVEAFNLQLQNVALLFKPVLSKHFESRRTLNVMKISRHTDQFNSDIELTNIYYHKKNRVTTRKSLS
jgi:hypothetical protein